MTSEQTPINHAEARIRKFAILSRFEVDRIIDIKTSRNKKGLHDVFLRHRLLLMEYADAWRKRLEREATGSITGSVNEVSEFNDARLAELPPDYLRELKPLFRMVKRTLVPPHPKGSLGWRKHIRKPTDLSTGH